MRLVGTGKDPLGRYPKGLVFDSARGTRECEDLLAKGFAVAGEYDGQAPGYFGEKRKVELAQAQLRGDALSLPHEREVGEEVAGHEYAIVHTDDANAKHGDDLKEAAAAREVGHLGAEGGPQVEVKEPIDPIVADAPTENVHKKAEHAKPAKQ